MKNFEALSKDLSKDTELQDVIKSCTTAEEIKDVLTERGYEITTKKINECVDEIFSKLSAAHPELKDRLSDEKDPDLNGFVFVFGIAFLTAALGADIVLLVDEIKSLKK